MSFYCAYLLLFLVKFEAEQLCPKLSQFQHGGYHNEYNIGICRMNCYSLIRILTIFYDYFLVRLLNAFTQFQASDRLGALFGVSILEDKGHARNELWDTMYQMSSHSSVLCKFSTFTFEYILMKKCTRKSYISYWISDSETCRRLNDLRYEIVLFISYNYNVHRSYLLILSCGCWPVVVKFEFARESYINYFISMPSNIS